MKDNKLKFFTLIAFVIACWLFGRYFNVDLEYYRNFLSQYPVSLSGVVFVCLYVLTTTFVWFGPKDVLRLSGAIFFGGLTSTIFVTIAELINATILFFLSRHLGRDFIKQKFGVRNAQLDQAKKDSGFWGVLAFRLNLLFPLRFVDLGYGLTSIRYFKFIVIAIISTPFRIFLQQYIMALVGEKLVTDFSDTVSIVQKDEFIMLYSAFYCGILVIVTIMAIVLRSLRKKGLKQHERRS